MNWLDFFRFACARHRSTFGSVVFFVTALGCNQPGIEEYKVKRVANVPASGDGGDGEAVRLLGAIFPRDDGAWFFKLVGPADAVKQVEDEVHRFIRSVRFTSKDDQPKWTVPAGWKPGKGNQFTTAAFMVGPEGNRVELTVSRAGGDLKQNIDRWRGQIGLAPLGPGELARESKVEEIDGVKATFVDFIGTKNKGGGMGPFAGGKQPPFAKSGGHAGKKPQFTVPEGWKEAPLKIFSVATFQVSDGAQTAEITLSPLAGAAGGMRENINRWRTQIGLAPASDEQVAKDLKPVEVDGAPGQLVDLVGEKKRILGAVVQRGGQSWFFKMTGDPGLVGSQQKAFEAFVKSTKFGRADQ